MMNKEQIREQVSNLVRAAGCGCCRNDEEWKQAQTKLADILNIERYDDDSGWDFYKYATKRK